MSNTFHGDGVPEPTGNGMETPLQRLTRILYGRQPNVMDQLAGGAVLLKDACDTIEKLHGLLEEEKNKSKSARERTLEKQRDDVLDYTVVLQRMIEAHCRGEELGDEFFVKSPHLCAKLNENRRHHIELALKAQRS